MEIVLAENSHLTARCVPPVVQLQVQFGLRAVVSLDFHLLPNVDCDINLKNLNKFNLFESHVCVLGIAISLKLTS